jgi:hypothetical protein
MLDEMDMRSAGLAQLDDPAVLERQTFASESGSHSPKSSGEEPERSSGTSAPSIRDREHARALGCCEFDRLHCAQRDTWAAEAAGEAAAGYFAVAARRQAMPSR